MKHVGTGRNYCDGLLNMLLSQHTESTDKNTSNILYYKTKSETQTQHPRQSQSWTWVPLLRMQQPLDGARGL